jgi:hypothetical protein
MTHTRIVGLALATALVLPAAATAQYPSSQPAPKAAKAGKPSSRTLRVCKRGCAFRTIRSAVRAARAGNTIRVGNGVYHEGVKIVGRSKRRLRLIGNPKHPGRVVIEGGHHVDNGVLINGADRVTLDGFTARNYTANGFFATNVVGYHFNHLDANHGGAYGLFAFNSKGGLMENSQASFNNDSGFYIGQTPRQKHPKRSLVRHVKAFANVLGWSGTNMRYVTITKSQWFNNGVGLVPNALDSEKFAPPEDNLIVDNDIFWNNFDYYRGAPFPIPSPDSTSTETAFPVGTGVLLFGGRRDKVVNNRIFGNFLVGVGAIKQILLTSQPQNQNLVGNQVRGNSFGLNGTDLNGRDLFYDGSGTNNCFGPNTGVRVTVPASGSTMVPCPFTGANAFDQAAQSEAFGWVGDATHEAHWIRHPHAPRRGVTPLEHFTP